MDTPDIENNETQANADTASPNVTPSPTVLFEFLQSKCMPVSTQAANSAVTRTLKQPEITKQQTISCFFQQSGTFQVTQHVQSASCLSASCLSASYLSASFTHAYLMQEHNSGLANQYSSSCIQCLAAVSHSDRCLTEQMTACSGASALSPLLSLPFF